MDMMPTTETPTQEQLEQDLKYYQDKVGTLELALSKQKAMVATIQRLLAVIVDVMTITREGG